MNNPARIALVLRRARLLIADPADWLKGTLSNPDKTCFCAMGALCHVHNHLIPSQTYQVAVVDAEKLLDKLAGKRLGYPCNYVAYNDLPDTTHDDILRLFDIAIAEADAQAMQQAAASALPVATEPKPDNKPFDLEDYLVASRPLVEPTPEPTIEPLPVIEQLRALDEALKSLQRAQGCLRDANDCLLGAEAQGFSVSVSTDPAQWQAASDAIKKRMDDLMPKFKAGDRVRLIQSKCPESIGALMTIVGPVDGLPGWYSAISDKPLMSASSLLGGFDESYDPKDEGLSTEADVFCTRMEKVESVEDLITELVTNTPGGLYLYFSDSGWGGTLYKEDDEGSSQVRDHRQSPNLLSALTSLRDKTKEANK